MNTACNVSKPIIRICNWKYDSIFAYSMTYDEGTVDVIANALPIHEKYGIPGHVDVVAGQLGQRRHAFCSSLNGYFHMGADELKFLLSKGWGVGNHSWSHYVYPCQPGLDLYREVVWSKYRLEDIINYPVRIFTIPNDSYNYEPVINMVKQHYLACTNIEGAPNRCDFDFYNIGNFILGSGKIPERAGWPKELYTENISLDFLCGSWLYETTHLIMWNVPQDHKCVTPEYMERRFQKLIDISGGRLWAAKPDDVIDYVLLKRNISVDNIREENGSIAFDIGGTWPVGVINSFLTLRVTNACFTTPPKVEQYFFGSKEGYNENNLGYREHNVVESIVRDEDDWLVSMQVAPGRTIRLVP